MVAPGGATPVCALLFLAGCIDTTLVGVGSSGDSGGKGPTETGSTTGEDTAHETGAETGTGTNQETGGETGESKAPPPPIVLQGDCLDLWTSWADPEPTSPELDVVSVYESQDGRPGPTYVSVTRASPAVLVLSSRQSVDWQVTLSSNHGVAQILLTSYEPSTVTFVDGPGVPVVDLGYLHACAYEIPDTHPRSGCETDELQAAIEGEAGLPMASFQGCYMGGHFLIGE